MSISFGVLPKRTSRKQPPTKYPLFPFEFNFSKIFVAFSSKV